VKKELLLRDFEFILLFSSLKSETIFHNNPQSLQASTRIIPEMRPQQTAAFPHPSQLISH
jgi:hypothetical protein